MKSTNIVWLIVGLIVILGGVYFFTSDNSVEPPAIDQSDTLGDDALTPDDADQSDGEPAADEPTMEDENGEAQSVTLSGEGFDPMTITVPVGTTVTWTNDGDGRMWVASDEHPTHVQYDDTSRTDHCAENYAGPEPFDQCSNGSTYSFTFTKAGTWNYHNHLNASQSGTVVVE